VRRWFRWLVRLPLTMARNARDTWREHKLLFIALGFGIGFFVAYFWNDIVVKIGSGESGVLYRLFQGGTVLTKVYGEGVWFVAPWNTMTVYNVRVQQTSDDFVVLSKDGLEVRVSVSIRFNPQKPHLAWLHQTYGPDYSDKIVKPEVQAEFRHVIGQYTPEEIYTSTGNILQTVLQGVMAELTERHVDLDDVLVKSILLPPSVAASIEAKLRAQQMALEMSYRLDIEEKEAERKKIEARGIRDFQDTITGGGISPEFLRFKGIEATLELAKSNNAKVIVVGGGADRLPLLFDGSVSTVPAATPAAPASSGAPASGSRRP
jgi:regulator of protease activity HflC (stomatin/prohibitin superfamily)